jgi:hypothetical protein
MADTVNSTPVSDELKPCPLCGMYLRRAVDPRLSGMLEHPPHVHCPISACCFLDTPLLRAAWNRRSSPSEAEADEALTLAKDAGADFVLDSLAKALGVTDWSQQDGSETWDGDVHATLMHLLWGAGVLDRDTNALLFATSEAAETHEAALSDERLRTLEEITQRYKEIEYKPLGRMEKIALRELMTLLTRRTQPSAGEGNLHIIFDGPPSHESGRFVEVENDAGASVRAGEWVERPDGLCDLVIPRATPPDQSKRVERLEAFDECASIAQDCPGITKPNPPSNVDPFWQGVAAAKVAIMQAIRARAMLAAAPASPSVDAPRVKELEWEDDDIADTLCGRYVIQEDGAAATSLQLVLIAQDQADLFHNTLREGLLTVDEAKAAAQADYEARIRSAIAAPSQQEGVTEEMVERARKAYEERGWQLLGSLEENRHQMRAALEAALVDRDRVKP